MAVIVVISVWRVLLTLPKQKSVSPLSIHSLFKFTLLPSCPFHLLLPFSFNPFHFTSPKRWKGLQPRIIINSHCGLQIIQHTISRLPPLIYSTAASPSSSSCYLHIFGIFSFLLSNYNPSSVFAPFSLTTWLFSTSCFHYFRQFPSMLFFFPYFLFDLYF